MPLWNRLCQLTAKGSIAAEEQVALEYGQWATTEESVDAALMNAATVVLAHSVDPAVAIEKLRTFHDGLVAEAGRRGVTFPHLTNQ